MKPERSSIPNTPFIFFRRDGWYIVELYGDKEDIENNAMANPGTLKIEDINGNVVWSLQ